MNLSDVFEKEDEVILKYYKHSAYGNTYYVCNDISFSYYEKGDVYSYDFEVSRWVPQCMQSYKNEFPGGFTITCMGNKDVTFEVYEEYNTKEDLLEAVRVHNYMKELVT